MNAKTDESPGAVAGQVERSVRRPHPTRACAGATTIDCRKGGEHGQRCRECGAWVRDDMVEHQFFGFAAGCDAEAALPECTCAAADMPYGRCCKAA